MWGRLSLARELEGVGGEEAVVEKSCMREEKKKRRGQKNHFFQL